MSLIKAMQFASKLRKKLKTKHPVFKKFSVKPKRKGLRGGMWAKRSAINQAYGWSTMGNVGQMHKYANIKKMSQTQRFGLGRGAGLYARGTARAHFAKRYPKTDIGIGAAKVAGIGALGAWILNDGDTKKKS